MENRAADFKIANAGTSLNTFFSESTWTIFDSKICLQSTWHWLLTLLKTFFSKLQFSCRKKRKKVILDGKSGCGFQNRKCRVKFEYVFLGKYSDDFRFKNMLRISIALAFDFT
jgi:hypothetical protein